MANLQEIARQRARLRAQNDYLRLRLSDHYEQLRPTAVWIEQGYHLAHALASPQDQSTSWMARLLALLRSK